jgi:hypothetical protein
VLHRAYFSKLVLDVQVEIYKWKYMGGSLGGNLWWWKSSSGILQIEIYNLETTEGTLIYRWKSTSGNLWKDLWVKIYGTGYLQVEI